MNLLTILMATGDIQPGEILSGGVDFMNTFYFIFLGVMLLLVVGGAYWLSSKGKFQVPFLTRFKYKIIVFEPATDGIVQRKAKGRKIIEEDGQVFLEVSEGNMKKVSRMLMPSFEFISSQSEIILWSPVADEFYPCKMGITAKDNLGKDMPYEAILQPQIDKSMKYIYAHTQEKIAARNREKTWLESIIPLAGVLLLGIICLMFIYVTWSQSGAYMAEVADAFVRASNNFACPSALPPI